MQTSQDQQTRIIVELQNALGDISQLGNKDVAGRIAIKALERFNALRREPTAPDNLYVQLRGIMWQYAEDFGSPVREEIQARIKKLECDNQLPHAAQVPAPRVTEADQKANARFKVYEARLAKIEHEADELNKRISIVAKSAASEDLVDLLAALAIHSTDTAWERFLHYQKAGEK